MSTLVPNLRVTIEITRAIVFSLQRHWSRWITLLGRDFTGFSSNLSRSHKEIFVKLQANLDGNRMAHNCFTDIYSERGANIILMRQSYREREDLEWLIHIHGNAVIWIRNNRSWARFLYGKRKDT